MAGGRARSNAKGPMRLDLGRVDLCLSVKDIAASRAFYRALGFRQVGGKFEQKWLIMTRGNLRLGLYQGHIGQNVVNFRGGHVGRIVEGLRAQGLEPYDVRKLTPQGVGSASVKDPDGNVLFFDSSPHERAARRRARARR
jgi:catechol 2,3-dioxygenase-like lactoylglutathione lyase family enzyme